VRSGPCGAPRAMFASRHTLTAASSSWGRMLRTFTGCSYARLPSRRLATFRSGPVGQVPATFPALFGRTRALSLLDVHVDAKSREGLPRSRAPTGGGQMVLARLDDGNRREHRILRSDPHSASPPLCQLTLGRGLLESIQAVEFGPRCGPRPRRLFRARADLPRRGVATRLRVPTSSRYLRTNQPVGLRERGPDLKTASQRSPASMRPHAVKAERELRFVKRRSVRGLAAR
jgi:hypothetical protein